MISVDLADGVSGAIFKYFVEELDLISPFSMRAFLPFGEHERFTGVEAAVDGRQ